MIFISALQLSEVQCVFRRSCGHSLVDRVNLLCKSRGGHNYMDIRYRRKRSIVSECCHKECYDSQVHKYCLHQDPSDDGPVDYQEQDKVMEAIPWYKRAPDMSLLELTMYQRTHFSGRTTTTTTTLYTTMQTPLAPPEIGTISPEYYNIPFFQFPTSRIIRM